LSCGAAPVNPNVRNKRNHPCMSNILFLALLATFGYFLIGNIYGAFTMYALLIEAEQSANITQHSYYRSIAFSVIRAAACSVGLATILLARKSRTVKLVSIVVLSALILMMLPSVSVIFLVVSVGGLSSAVNVLPLLLSLVWLSLLLVAVISNKGFNRAPVSSAAAKPGEPGGGAG
jgi:hypothetical protein